MRNNHGLICAGVSLKIQHNSAETYRFNYINYYSCNVNCTSFNKIYIQASKV